MSQTIHSFIHSIIFFLSPVIPMIIYVSSASRDVTGRKQREEKTDEEERKRKREREREKGKPRRMLP